MHNRTAIPGLQKKARGTRSENLRFTWSKPRYCRNASVHEAQECEDQVFTVAINFLDRFLCSCQVQRTQLQLLGAVCLLLASKLRQCRPLSVELLEYYTDYSVSCDEIKSERKVGNGYH
ncbi:G1/S-specific cyclin-D3 [Halocaridina rubra]|uniref:G1/S-specific cyclin-D3 n=1 Tax=Halocaridina rubra TaxID=373956 RepID=A0AAN8XWE5_HALRR